MRWFNKDKYESEKNALVKLLTETAAGRSAGKAVESQWGKRFDTSETAIMLAHYLAYADKNMTQYSGAGNEVKVWLSNEFFKYIVNEMSPPPWDKKPYGLRDRVWVVLDTLMQVIQDPKYRDIYYKYWQPSSHNEPEEPQGREPDRTAYRTTDYTEVPKVPGPGDGMHILPIVIGVGALIAIMAMRK